MSTLPGDITGLLLSHRDCIVNHEQPDECGRSEEHKQTNKRYKQDRVLPRWKVLQNVVVLVNKGLLQ